jgi:hypothetical protein
MDLVASFGKAKTATQGGNGYLKIPGEKLEIQWHTVLYGGDDNYQEKQKSDD